MKVFTFALGEMRTNTYFCLDERGNCAVIDPGMDGKGIYEKLCSKNLRPTHILLTHGHFDHSQGVRDLAELTGAQVYIHREDGVMLENPRYNSANFYYRGNLEGYPCTSADVLLSHGDEIRVGDLSFRVIHTPGHTPGSVCFLAGDSLFCGDTVFAYGFGRYDLWGGDREALRESLRLLSTLDGGLKLCPGHGNTVTLERIRARLFEDIEAL